MMLLLVAAALICLATVAWCLAPCPRAQGVAVWFLFVLGAFYQAGSGDLFGAAISLATGLLLGGLVSHVGTMTRVPPSTEEP